jgi:hypothetical protein
MLRYDYVERIKFLIQLECGEEPEIMYDDVDGDYRILMISLFETTVLDIMVFVPKECSNVNDINFYGIDAGKTRHAILEGLSDEEITENIDNHIHLQDEQNAVNFICGRKYLRKNEEAIAYAEKILEKLS